MLVTMCMYLHVTERMFQIYFLLLHEVIAPFFCNDSICLLIQLNCILALQLCLCILDIFVTFVVKVFLIYTFAVAI